MSEVVAGQSLHGNIGTVVFDLDGVVYVDGHGVAGAGRALRRLSRAGVEVLFASNNSTKTPESAARTIELTTGYPCHPDQVVTSSLVTAHGLAGRYAHAFVVGELGLVETLTAAGVGIVSEWRAADVVVVGLDRELAYADLAGAALAINVGGAAFVATNTDATFPTREGPVPGGGAIVAAIATATGAVPEVFGKPLEPFRAFVRARTAGPVMMVGDRAETDVALGKAEGWTTVLVMTGVTTDAADVPPQFRPDHVVASIADIPALLGLPDDAP